MSERHTATRRAEMSPIYPRVSRPSCAGPCADPVHDGHRGPGRPAFLSSGRRATVVCRPREGIQAGRDARAHTAKKVAATRRWTSSVGPGDRGHRRPRTGAASGNRQPAQSRPATCRRTCSSSHAEGREESDPRKAPKGRIDDDLRAAGSAVPDHVPEALEAPDRWDWFGQERREDVEGSWSHTHPWRRAHPSSARGLSQVDLRHIDHRNRGSTSAPI